MKHKGFAALSAVLIIAAVVMAVTTTVTLLAIGEGQAALTVELGGGDGYLVDGCAEDVLQEIHDDAAYNQTTISLPEGTCGGSYSLPGPVNWDLTVSETGTAFGRKVRVVFTRGQTITLSSWQEI